MNCKSTKKTLKQLNKILAQTLTALITLYGTFSKRKTNATSHPNIGSLKSAMEEKSNVWRIYFERMQIVSKTCWYNNWKMVAILS